MATIAKLRGLAKSSLTPYMSSLGFSLGTGLTYKRERSGGIWDVVYVEIYAGGSMARAFISCYVREVYGEFLPDKLPKGYGFPCGGLLAPDGLNSAWDCPVESVDEAEIYLTKLITVVERIAIPFFSSVSTRQEFWDHLDDDLKKVEKIAARKERVLAPT